MNRDRVRLRRIGISDPVYASAYDPESNLRLLRFAGNVEIEWLIERGPRHPTHRYLPHCLTLVDQRRARFKGGPAEISRSVRLWESS
jgi:hypothetical protein